MSEFSLTRTPVFPLLLMLALGPTLASAQQPEPQGFEWSSELSVLGANALLGGLTAGVAAIIRNERPGKAFMHGLGGGAVVYAGKRIAVQEWFGAGLVARQVGLVGSSAIRNAADGRGTLDRVAFGLGPIRGYVGKAFPGVRWGLDVPAATSGIWGVIDSSRRVDPTESLSSGALVFVADDGVSGDGAAPGTIFYHRNSSNPDREAYVLAHERVHILQFDQSFLLWGDPFESWAARRLPVLQAPLDYLEFNVAGLGAGALLAILAWPEHDQQPWEVEAMYLGRSR